MTIQNSFGMPIINSEPKRDHQWLVSDSEMLFSANKKQAMMSSNVNPLLDSGSGSGSGSDSMKKEPSFRIFGFDLRSHNILNTHDNKNVNSLQAPSNQNPGLTGSRLQTDSLLDLSLLNARRCLNHLKSGAPIGSQRLGSNVVVDQGSAPLAQVSCRGANSGSGQSYFIGAESPLAPKKRGRGRPIVPYDVYFRRKIIECLEAHRKCWK